MSFSNRIIETKGTRITLETCGAIELGVARVRTVAIYTCPLQVKNITDTDEWEYSAGMLEVDKPGRYLIEYD